VEILNALAHKAAKAAAIKLTQKDSKQFNHGEMINVGYGINDSSVSSLRLCG
jgi:hypothetical protein